MRAIAREPRVPTSLFRTEHNGDYSEERDVRMTRLYCLVEDRRSEEIGLRFAIVSLLRACDTARVVVHRPNPTTDFRKWISGHSRVIFIPELPPTASSWNCKPHVMLPLLEGNVDEVIWLD